MSKLAVFFDAENVPAQKVPEIKDFLSTKGDVLFQRAYADWSIENTKSWKEQISKTPITAIHQFHHDEKQAVDKAIMMDAIELAIKHEEIDIFALVSSDKGYYSLSLRLRELGKKVLGIGEKNKCSPIWINSCNEFAYFEDLEESDDDILLEAESKGENDPAVFETFPLEKFLEKSFDSTPFYKETNTKLLSQMWESVLRQKSDFNVRDYNHKTALELISSFNSMFKISDDGRNQRTFFVEKIENNSNQRKTGSVKRRIKNYRIIQADDKSGDYFFYMGDINKDFKHEKLEKGTKVEFLVSKEPAPNANNMKDKNGRACDLKVI